METSSSGVCGNKQEQGFESSPEGAELEDFVMVPSQLTMDAAEMRKHNRRARFVGLHFVHLALKRNNLV